MEDFAKGILYNLGYLSRDQADAAQFGIVKVDDQGQILLYNRQSLPEFLLQVRKGKISLLKLRFAQIIVCSLESLKMELQVDI